MAGKLDFFSAEGSDTRRFFCFRRQFVLRTLTTRFAILKSGHKRLTLVCPGECPALIKPCCKALSVKTSIKVKDLLYVKNPEFFFFIPIHPTVPTHGLFIINP